MKILAVIDIVGQIRTTPSGKKLRDIQVRKLDTKEEIKVAVFLGTDRATGEVQNFVCSPGQEIEMEVNAKEYKGKWQYSTGTWLITPVVPTPQEELPKNTPPIATEEGPVDWDGKERRQFKGKCMMYAQEVMKVVYKDHKFESEGEYIGMSTLIAEQYLDWVYIA